MLSRALVFSLLVFCVVVPELLAAPRPRNLDEAQRDFEQWLGPAGVQRVKQAQSEQDMLSIIGILDAVSLTNRWHLWENPPLARYFKALGVTGPHDMVGIVSATYWCKLHGKPLRLLERTAEYHRLEAASEHEK